MGLCGMFYNNVGTLPDILFVLERNYKYVILKNSKKLDKISHHLCVVALRILKDELILS